MAEHVFLLVIGLPLATILLIFGMRYTSLVLQARARGQSDVERQELSDSIEDLKTRLTRIETILKEVE